jgi:hypothetical protein
MSRKSHWSAAAVALAFLFCLGGEQAQAQYRGPTGFRGSARSSLGRVGSMGFRPGQSMARGIPGRGMTRPRSPIVAPKPPPRTVVSTQTRYDNPVRPTAPRPPLPGRPR